MKIAVTGGRNFNNAKMVFETLDYIQEKYNISELIHGGAKGTDTLAGLWAKNRNILVSVFMPDWKIYGKRAGILRNLEMLNQKPEMVVAFPGGRGTSHMTTSAKSQGIKIITQM